MGIKEESSEVITRVGYSGKPRPTLCKGGKCYVCNRSVWVEVSPVKVHTNIIQYVHFGCLPVDHPKEHSWGEPDIDWMATRICKKCGIVNKYDHGPNNGPSIFKLGSHIFKKDPGCISNIIPVPIYK